MNLLDLAKFGDQRNVQVVSDTSEAKLVLFSLRNGQTAQGRGEPRVHLLALAGEGELWTGEVRMAARAGTILESDAGVHHGMQAADGDFLVLGIITPAP